MNKNTLGLVTISAGLVLLCSLVAFAFLQSQLKVNAQQETTKETKHKTLRDAAAERDFDVSADTLETELTDLASVIKFSNAIVVGRITEAKSDFTGSGDFVETFYKIDNVRVVKDTTSEGAWRHIDSSSPPSPLAAPLKLARIGGVVEKNGRRTRLKVNGVDKLKEGKTYVFFLQWSTAGKTYVLTGGTSGVFAVNESDSSIKPLSTQKQFTDKYAGLDLESFLQEASATN